ncbi:hypothetical protein GM3708_2527 [Geminocystis sp. NIES-3708]|uniref:pentapeptide repeat-containing protein n=1 Tax=Geminocystis sp. NIES-3708 TaxID=1615909 RepID=UPI0005FCAD41|nr:pentapeptide repeat-containing protein [Geminocystis sp. NIES-3708]BAQ62121.1 hypothetical protein GM3708_2527 [Geminocystis sp. NIES-3708]
MANQQHLQLIISLSSDEWNNWRKENPHIVPDLREANLSGVNLSKFNLRGANLIEANLSQSNLTETNLSKADLFKADFSRAYGRDANLSVSNLQDANFFGAYFSGSDFSRSNLLNANFQEANCSESFFITANLNYAKLSRGIFQGVSFMEANLSEADCGETILNQSDFTLVKANNTNFDQATLTGVIIEDWEINNQTKFDKVFASYVFITRQEKLTTDIQVFENTTIFLNFIMKNKTKSDKSQNSEKKIIDILQVKKVAIEEQIQELIKVNNNQFLKYTINC